MKVAADSSIFAPRFARLVSISMRLRSIATVERRSSHIATGKGTIRARLRAKALVDCALAPSLPSILRGKPRTNPTAERSLASRASSAASAVNFVRLMVRTGVATRRSGSQEATPMVFSPRSSPRSVPRAPKSSAASSNSSAIEAGYGAAARLWKATNLRLFSASALLSLAALLVAACSERRESPRIDGDVLITIEQSATGPWRVDYQFAQPQQALDLGADEAGDRAANR